MEIAANTNDVRVDHLPSLFIKTHMVYESHRVSMNFHG